VGNIRQFSVRGVVCWLKAKLLDGMREGTSPAKVSSGFALGLFIGIFPTLAIGSPLAFWAARRLGWNAGAALAGTLLMNPLTAPPIYSLSLWLGAELLGQRLELSHVHGLLDYLRQAGGAFLLGNTIVALSSALLSGLGVHWFLLRRFRLDLQPLTPVVTPGLPACPSVAGTRVPAAH